MPKFRAYKEITIAEEITILVQFTADTMRQALEFNQCDISGAMAEHWQDAEISEDRPYGDQEIETCLEFTTVDGDSLDQEPKLSKLWTALHSFWIFSRSTHVHVKASCKYSSPSLPIVSRA